MELLPDDLLVTRRMFLVLPSLLTTDRLCLDQETSQSSYGTLLESASTPFMMSVTLSGFPVSDFHLTLVILSLSLLDGTSLSRYSLVMPELKITLK